MALAGEEIRNRLSAFASRWSVYSGSEPAEAQAVTVARLGRDRRRQAGRRGTLACAPPLELLDAVSGALFRNVAVQDIIYGAIIFVAMLVGRTAGQW